MQNCIISRVFQQNETTSHVVLYIHIHDLWWFVWFDVLLIFIPKENLEWINYFFITIKVFSDDYTL